MRADMRGRERKGISMLGTSAYISMGQIGIGCGAGQDETDGD